MVSHARASAIKQQAMIVQSVCGLLYLALWLLCCGGVRYLSAISATFSVPITMIWILFVGLLDLLIRSPFLSAQARFYYMVAVGDGGEKQWLSQSFCRTEYKKALLVRLYLWKERALWSVLALLPAGWISGCAELIQTTDQVFSASVTSLLLHVVSVLFLAAGFLFVEFRMLRLWLVWVALSQSETALEAVRRSESVVKGKIGESVNLKVRALANQLAYVLVIPYFYTVPQYRIAEASWFQKQFTDFQRQQ